MAKEIIMHYDAGPGYSACGLCYERQRTTHDKDAVTCIRCQGTHAFRGIVPSWYTTAQEKFTNMTTIQLLTELDKYVRYFWRNSERETYGILLSEIKGRMIERNA